MRQRLARSKPNDSHRAGAVKPHFRKADPLAPLLAPLLLLALANCYCSGAMDGLAPAGHGLGAPGKGRFSGQMARRGHARATVFSPECHVERERRGP